MNTTNPSRLLHLHQLLHTWYGTYLDNIVVVLKKVKKKVPRLWYFRQPQFDQDMYVEVYSPHVSINIRFTYRAANILNSFFDQTTKLL